MLSRVKFGTKQPSIRRKLVPKRWAAQPIEEPLFISIGPLRRWIIFRKVVMFQSRRLMSDLTCAMRFFRLKNSTGYWKTYAEPNLFRKLSVISVVLEESLATWFTTTHSWVIGKKPPSQAGEVWLWRKLWVISPFRSS